LYIDKLWPIIDLFNQRFFLGIARNEHHLAVYPPGTHYEKHVDTFKNSDSRVVSTVLYLNRNWKAADGGELVLYPERGNAVTIEPTAGRLVLFESILPHEVLLSHSNRYSITGWFRRREGF
jgi:SM-20-related protein